jgi:hypothetical protein
MTRTAASFFPGAGQVVRAIAAVDRRGPPGNRILGTATLVVSLAKGVGKV